MKVEGKYPVVVMKGKERKREEKEREKSVC